MKYTNIAILKFRDFEIGNIYQHGSGKTYQYFFRSKFGSGELGKDQSIEDLAFNLSNVLGVEITATLRERKTRDTFKYAPKEGDSAPIGAEGVTFAVSVIRACRGFVKRDGSGAIELRRFDTLKEAKEYEEEQGFKWKAEGYACEDGKKHLMQEDEIVVRLDIYQFEGTEKTEDIALSTVYAKEKVSDA
jgi:hypothetical protein